MTVAHSPAARNAMVSLVTGRVDEGSAANGVLQLQDAVGNEVATLIFDIQYRSDDAIAQKLRENLQGVY